MAYYVVPGHAYNRIVARAILQGNIINRSEQLLWDVRLKFEVGDDKSSEFLYYTIENLGPGEKKDFYFEYNAEGKLYNFDKAWVKYIGVDQYKTPVKTTTFMQTTTIAEPSIFTGTVTLTTVRMITEPASPTPVPWDVIILVEVVASAVAVAFVHRKMRRVEKPSMPLVFVHPDAPSMRALETPSVRTKHCPDCGLVMPLDAKHCPKCGTKQDYFGED